jgi:hypothetical protein
MHTGSSARDEMMLKSRISREQALVIVLALARLAVCCYRAVTQSITYDEAMTFNRFVDGPWSNIYKPYYDANNHILYSILAKLSIRAFGLSEFSLRLPSVIAGFFLVLGLFWVLQAYCSRPIRWAVLIALSIHPLLMEFSVAARGYGLGWALLVWAIYLSMRGRYVLAGTLLGLAVSANLTNVLPSLGLMLAAAFLERGSAKHRIGVLAAMMLPAATLAVVICSAALSSAHRDNFYYGYPAIADSILSLIRFSFRADVGRAGLFGTDAADRAMRAYWLPLVCTFIVIASILDLRRNSQGLRRFLPLLTLVTTLLGLAAAHYLFDVKYPADRTGMHLVLLFALAWAVAVDGTRNKPVIWVHVVLGVFVTVQFVTQFHLVFFQSWKFDMDSRTVAQQLKAACEGRPANSVALSCTEKHQPSLEFYRECLGIRALQPVLRRISAPLSGFDFYVLNYPDTLGVETAQLRVLYTGPQTGVILATGPTTP